MVLQETFRSTDFFVVGDIKDKIKDVVNDIKEHLYYVHKAIAAGANCFGNHLWMPIDCFRWRNSYKNRYGLIAVDVHRQDKTLKKISSLL